MKKRVLIIIAVLLAIAISVIAIVYFLNYCKNTGHSEYDYKTVLKLTPILRSNTFSEVQDKANQCDVDLITSEEGGYCGFDSVPVGKASLSAYFVYENDKIVDTSAKVEFSELYEGEDGAIRLEDDLLQAVGICSDIMGTDLSDYFNVFHNTGYVLDKLKTDTYRQVLNYEAYMLITVKESADVYWDIAGYMGEDGFSVYLNRIYESVEDAYADIILE